MTTTAQPNAEPQTRRVTLLQGTVPHYRIPVLVELSALLGDGFVVMAGKSYFDPTVVLGDTSRLPLTMIDNRYLFGRRFLWQRGALATALNADVLIAELNPRVLSTWVILLIRHFRRDPSILWGHAWPRAGRGTAGDHARHVMRRLADALIVYTETQATELRARMPGKPIFASPNALYRQAEQPVTSRRARTSFVVVGRLVAAKKPHLALEAFVAALDELPPDTTMKFIGDGPLRDELSQLARRSPSPSRIQFTGEVINRHELEVVYQVALASVVPGYAGLSLVQSYWFGVPAIVARDEPHSPEIESLIPGWNGIEFASDSTAALRQMLIDTACGSPPWSASPADIAGWCAQRYSLEMMAGAIARAVDSLHPRADSQNP